MNLNESFAGLLNLNSDLPIIPTIKRRINQEVEDRYQEPFTGHFFFFYKSTNSINGFVLCYFDSKP